MLGLGGGPLSAVEGWFWVPIHPASAIVAATSEANDMPWGQRVAHIKDPDGNVVNLTQQL